MNALTADNIRNSANLVGLHELSGDVVANIIAMLTPYASALEAATTLQSISDWIGEVFPSSLNESLMETVSLVSQERKDVSACVFYVMDDLTAEIVSRIQEMQSRYITPWTVRQSLNTLPTLFGSSDTVSITVSMGPQEFTHDITEEFVTGLLALYGAAQQPVRLTVYGRMLSYLPLLQAYTESKPSVYTVKLSSVTYFFDTLDFMHGVNTAALWLNVDDRQYWSDFHRGNEEVCLL